MSSNPRSPFVVLGIEPTRDHAAVKAAYRRRCMETHPDHNPGAEGNAFRAVQAAWERLDTPQKVAAAFERGTPGGVLLTIAGDFGLDLEVVVTSEGVVMRRPS